MALNHRENSSSSFKTLAFLRDLFGPSSPCSRNINLTAQCLPGHLSASPVGREPLRAGLCLSHHRPWQGSHAQCREPGFYGDPGSISWLEELGKAINPPLRGAELAAAYSPPSGGSVQGSCEHPHPGDLPAPCRVWAVRTSVGRWEVSEGTA